MFKITVSLVSRQSLANLQSSNLSLPSTFFNCLHAINLFLRIVRQSISAIFTPRLLVTIQA